jgi:hypothetical protein
VSTACPVPDCRMSNRAKFLIGAGIVAFFTVPIFRSGGRTNLTMFQWIVNHSIFGPAVEYVPLEQYEEEVKGVQCPTSATSSVETE